MCMIVMAQFNGNLIHSSAVPNVFRYISGYVAVMAVRMEMRSESPVQSGNCYVPGFIT